MTIPISTLIAPGTADDYLAKMLAAATTLNLSVTSWQEGDPSLTILEIMADVMAARDASIETTFIEAGLLDFAALPTVTPEPVRGIIFTPGWLDMTADQMFDTQRLEATYAICTVTFANSTGSTITYPVGTYHATDAVGVGSFSNTTILTIPSGASGPFVLTSDVIGAGQIAPTAATVQVPLLTATVAGFAQGSDYESNALLVIRCRDKFQTLSLGGPAGAYDYFARTIPSEDASTVSSGLRTTPSAPCTKTLMVATTGGPLSTPDVAMYCANASGAYAVADTYTDSIAYAVANAVNHTTDVTITTTLAHGYSTGDNVYLVGVGGYTGLDNTDTNPTWQISNVTTYGFRVPATALGGYTSGGTVYRVSDCDLIKRNLLNYCVPEGILCGVATAVADNVTIAWYATIKAAGATQAFVDKANTAITSFLASLPIAGYTVTGGKGIPFGVIVGTVWAQDPINVVAVHVRIAGVLDTDYVMSGSNHVAGITSLAPTLITQTAYITVV